jgi:hypothetical protein
MGMHVIVKDWGAFQDEKKRNGVKHSVLSTRHWEMNSPFSKAKSTLELLIKKTVNVPEWSSYSFHLSLLIHPWQDLEMHGCNYCLRFFYKVLTQRCE